MIRFLLAILLASALLLVGIFIFKELGRPAPGFGWQIVTFLAITTLLLYGFITRFQERGLFVHAVMGSILIKLLASLGFLVLIVLKDPTGALPNAIVFLTGYALFTAIEVVFLYLKIER